MPECNVSTLSSDGRAQARRDAALLRTYARTGDPALRRRLVESFQPLARSLAARYYSGGEPMEDLVQVANVGLIKAIDGFDPKIGRSFAAYAAPTILGELRHYFRDHTWAVRLPRRLQERAMRIAAVNDEIRAQEQRTPSAAEVAARCGLSEAEVVEAMVADGARRTASLDRPAGRDEHRSAPLVEMINGEEAGYDRIEADDAAASAPLLPRERQVLELRFRCEMTQRQVGRELGISQMQVSRLQRSALLKLLAAVRGDQEPGRAEPVGA